MPRPAYRSAAPTPPTGHGICGAVRQAYQLGTHVPRQSYRIAAPPSAPSAPTGHGNCKSIGQTSLQGLPSSSRFTVVHRTTSLVPAGNRSCGDVHPATLKAIQIPRPNRSIVVAPQVRRIAVACPRLVPSLSKGSLGSPSCPTATADAGRSLPAATTRPLAASGDRPDHAGRQPLAPDSSASAVPAADAPTAVPCGWAAVAPHAGAPARAEECAVVMTAPDAQMKHCNEGGVFPQASMKEDEILMLPADAPARSRDAVASLADAPTEEGDMPAQVLALVAPEEDVVSSAQVLAKQLPQLRIVVAGLMGSGKSTLCRALANLFQGKWVNQDEFAHRKRGAKKAFLSEIRRVAADPGVACVLVDKINTMRQHRAEVLDALAVDGETGSAAVLVRLQHPLDAPGEFDHAIQLCLDRIQKRGAGHRTLFGLDPKLEMILRSTVKSAEPLDEEEAAGFRCVLDIDFTGDAITVVSAVVEGLSNAGLLGERVGAGGLDALKQRVPDATRVALEAEERLRQGADKEHQLGA